VVATYTSGQKLSATDMNNNLTKYLFARGTTASATVTTSVADLDGCTLTFTNPEAGQQVIVIGSFDVQSTGTTDIFSGILDSDGSDATAQAIFNGTGRATVVQTWRTTLSTAASHTLKLQVQKTNNSNTVTVRSGSSITVIGNGLT
jgi:hypothetical protein